MSSLSVEQCSSCGPKPYGTKTVSLDGEPFTFPLLHYPQCGRTDTTPEVDTRDTRIVYHHCPVHRIARGP